MPARWSTSRALLSCLPDEIDVWIADVEALEAETMAAWERQQNSVPVSALALLLDEMYSAVIAAQLRERGLDLIGVVEDPERVSTADEEATPPPRRTGT